MRKKISVISSTITLTILVFLLVLTVNAKQVTSEIWEATWRSLIPEGLIQDDSEIKNVFSNLFGEDSSSKNILDNEEINKFIKKFSGETEETVEQFIDEQEQNMDPQQQMVINTFRFLSNVKIRYVLMILILLVVCSIAVMQNSYFKWTGSMACALTASGGLLIAFCELLKKYVFSYVRVEVTLNSLLDPAQYLILGGILMGVLYFVVNAVININKKIDKEEKDEVSKESEA